ncbi:hypothetical protein RHGRI_025731 [Rhododendron griersonianum]|uniref:KAT8 regulatory NSL complex subunit 2 n=1 Tax=Rhododendron griersonianum TaxID=479676 RepID=A0AAV6IR13_9ERIC|nr:hypothetical protein RHGRI_025731 [Rhododendron griersonianum]
MASSRLHHHPHIPPPSLPPSSSSNPQNPNPNPTTTPPPQDHLTRRQVLTRRADNLRRLARVYTDHYWGMVEELKGKYKEYVWKYGLSPYEEGDGDEGRGIKDLEGNMNNAHALCAFNGCALKAMALTRFCHLHILSDSKQVLYKPCEYAIKSAQAGPITCGRPILRGRIPAFCNVHLQKVNRALKKAGLHSSSSSKLAPKFHVIVAEYVRQIQANRRVALRANTKNVVVKRESCN